MRKTNPSSAEPDIEMRDMRSWSPRSTSLGAAVQVNNPVVPNHIVRANNPDNIRRPAHNPSHNSWWLRGDDDDESGPSTPPSRSGARNPIASTLSNTPGASGRPRTRNPYTVTWLDTAPRPTSSVYPPPPSPSSSSGPSWKLPAPESIFSSHSVDVHSTDSLAHPSTSRNDIRVPRISRRAASYAAVLDVQAGIDARKSEVPQPLREEIPASPTGSVDSIDFFSGKAAEVGSGERVERGGDRVERGGGRVVPQRPQRFEGVSPYVAWYTQSLLFATICSGKFYVSLRCLTCF
jgi:hypothetical protein